MKINGNYGADMINNNVKAKGTKPVSGQSTKTKFSEQVSLFEEKARDRIENGDPVFTMGMTAMTEEDWESLMKKVDSYMEKVRVMNEAKKEQIQEESLEKKIYDRIMVLTKDK